MPQEPQVKRAVAFFDGQNLFHATKYAFGCWYPSYDPQALAENICTLQGWQLEQIRFYTGVPRFKDNPRWQKFWERKLAWMGRKNIYIYTRELQSKLAYVRLRDGQFQERRIGQEKGIDVRIALDMVRLARDGQYDVALLFSQDQDLSEAVNEIRDFAGKNDRWIKLASAFPKSSVYKDSRGVNRTDWIPIDASLFYKCIDKTNQPDLGP